MAGKGEVKSEARNPKPRRAPVARAKVESDGAADLRTQLYERFGSKREIWISVFGLRISFGLRASDIPPLLTESVGMGIAGFFRTPLAIGAGSA